MEASKSQAKPPATAPKTAGDTKAKPTISPVSVPIAKTTEKKPAAKPAPSTTDLKQQTAKALTTINVEKDAEVIKLRSQLKKVKDEGKKITCYQNMTLIFILILLASQAALCYLAYKQNGKLF